MGPPLIKALRLSHWNSGFTHAHRKDTIYPADLVVSVEVLIGAEGHFSFADGRIDWG